MLHPILLCEVSACLAAAKPGLSYIYKRVSQKGFFSDPPLPAQPGLLLCGCNGGCAARQRSKPHPSPRPYSRESKHQQSGNAPPGNVRVPFRSAQLLGRFTHYSRFRSTASCAISWRQSQHSRLRHTRCWMYSSICNTAIIFITAAPGRVDQGVGFFSVTTSILMPKTSGSWARAIRSNRLRPNSNQPANPGRFPASHRLAQPSRRSGTLFAVLVGCL